MRSESAGREAISAVHEISTVRPRESGDPARQIEEWEPVALGSRLRGNERRERELERTFGKASAVVPSMTEATSTAPARSAAFIFVFITVLLDMLALGIIIPVLPRLVVDFVGGDAARGADYLGLFGTAWALMQFVFSPAHGMLSDRFGRKPVILISNFGLGLDYIVMALAPNLWWLFGGRIISGITTSNISATSAYIADVMPPE